MCAALFAGVLRYTSIEAAVGITPPSLIIIIIQPRRVRRPPILSRSQPASLSCENREDGQFGSSCSDGKRGRSTCSGLRCHHMAKNRAGKLVRNSG
ncbi:hypothetical protein K456DRAFT_1161813 [Colletotrichum gloeosporioides 23]|nr:hypothetical protein K456DRAFT_1161813 [Colletotrichum gloeosporioides 23]